MTDERRADKRVQITGIDKSGLQFVERSRLEDIGDSGCRFSLRGQVPQGNVIGVMPLGRMARPLSMSFAVCLWSFG